MDVKEALEWADKVTAYKSDYAANVAKTLAAAVRELEAEITDLHADGMVIYAMMNDEMVAKLKAENAALRKVVDAAVAIEEER